MVYNLYNGKRVDEFSIIVKLKTDDGVWHDVSKQNIDDIWYLSDRVFEKLLWIDEKEYEEYLDK